MQILSIVQRNYDKKIIHQNKSTAMNKNLKFILTVIKYICAALLGAGATEVLF